MENQIKTNEQSDTMSEANNLKKYEYHMLAPENFQPKGDCDFTKIYPEKCNAKVTITDIHGKIKNDSFTKIKKIKFIDNNNVCIYKYGYIPSEYDTYNISTKNTFMMTDNESMTINVATINK